MVYVVADEATIDNLVNGEGGLAVVPSGTFGAELPELQNGSFTKEDENATVVLVCKANDSDVGVVAYAVLTLPTVSNNNNNNTPAANITQYLSITENGGVYTVNGLAQFEETGYSMVYAVADEATIDNMINGENGLAVVPSGTFGAELSELQNGSFTNEDENATVVLVCKANTQAYVVAYAVLTVPAVSNNNNNNAPVTIGNNGYPYGKNMANSYVTLVIDVAEENVTYQWQIGDDKNGTYTDISGATGATYTLYPTSGKWYRCMVNGVPSKPVQIVSPGYDGRTWTGYSGSYYITNGTMAYRVDGNYFDVTGLYYKNSYAYMLQTSYSKKWEMYSSTSATPGASSNRGYAELDAMKVSFDESDAYRLLFEADLKDGQQAFAFGCDTMLGNSSTSGSYSDYAALIGTVKNGVLQQVAMIGAASEQTAQGSDPAFVIAPESITPASRFWLGHYSSRMAYVYNNGSASGSEVINGQSVVTRVENTDSGMTMSWLNIPSGGSVKFVFKVGSVADTGAVPGAEVETTSKTITIKSTETDFFYQIKDENGNPLTGVTYKDANGNTLTPDANGWVRGVGGNIVISGLQQSTNYKIVTAATDENGNIDNNNTAVENVTTPINPGVTTNPGTGEEVEVDCTANGNSLTFTGLDGNNYYFLKTSDGSEIIGGYPTNGELAFTGLPAGCDFYLAAVSSTNQNYELVLYSTIPVAIIYDANGGTNAPAAQTLSGANQTITSATPYREGYVFQGWAASANAAQAQYAPQGSPRLSGDTTLYAVWKEIEKADLTGTVHFNYSYSYTVSNGSVQSGTQNVGERATKVRVTLLKNGVSVGDPIDVTAVMSGNTANADYIFENMPLTDESGRSFTYTVQAVVLRDDGTETHDYGVYCRDYSSVSLSYSPECFDAEWKVTINKDERYIVPDSIYVKVLYATEAGADLNEYQVITQQAVGYGTECVKVANGNTYTYSGSYPVWKYQADVGGSYYHKFQVVGYVLNGVYVDLTEEGYVFAGEMIYDSDNDRASEVMELTYDKTVIPTVTVGGSLLVNYSYSYTMPDGSKQEGTQNDRERAATVRVELLCNGTVVNSANVALTITGEKARGSYDFGPQLKYAATDSINTYSVRVIALSDKGLPVNDYGVDISTFNAILTYSPECFDAAWKVTLDTGITEGIPSSVNVKVLYATAADTAVEDYEIISQQAENLGVECFAVTENGVTTYSGSYPVWKYQANVGGSYFHKIQIVGYTIDGVYYDVSYRNLVSDGEMIFDGTQASGIMEQTLVPEIPDAEITVSGKVLDINNVGVLGAKVELRKGTEVIATTITDIYGHYSFVDVPDGDYNIVVTYKDGVGDDASEKILTELVGVNRESGESPNITVEMPSGNVSSKVDIKDSEEEQVHDKIDLGGTLVAGVDQIAKNETPESNEHVTITLEVTPKADVTNSSEESDAEIKAEQAEIKKQAIGQTVEFLDLSLIKTVTTDNDPATSTKSAIEEASALLTIILPFKTENTRNIVVYRYHGTEAAAMTENPETGAEGFVVGKDKITIYTYKFSTYAIGYSKVNLGYTATSSSTVTIPEGIPGGKIVVSDKYAVQGQTVTITVTPDKDRELETLTVTDSNGREIAVTYIGGGKYTFVMPQGAISINATFARKSASCGEGADCPIWPYIDASTTAWYHDGVHYCIEHGLMDGMAANLFAPNGTTTRAQIVTILWRLEGEPRANYAMSFVDVAAGNWYTEAVRWAAANGIVDGYSDTVFAPGDAITREQMAAILWRYCQYKGVDVSVGEDTNILSYDDVFDVHSWAMEAMQWACGAGVIGGIADGNGMKLDPSGSATRAQVATMLQRFCVEVMNI